MEEEKKRVKNEYLFICKQKEELQTKLQIAIYNLNKMQKRYLYNYSMVFFIILLYNVSTQLKHVFFEREVLQCNEIEEEQKWLVYR